MAPVAADPLARLRWAGFGGVLALSAGATVAGVFPRPDPARSWPVLGPLRSHPSLGIALATAGMLVLVAAWWRVGRHGPPVRWTVRTTALWCLPLLCAPPLFSRDVYAYAAQGDLFAHGLDPYTAGPAALPSEWLGSISPTWWDSPAPYGPLFLMLARTAVGLSGGHLLVAVLLLRLAALAGVLLVAVYLPRLARACGTDARTATWLGLGSPLLLTHLASGAHNDALMLGLLVAGLAYAVERHAVAAAALVGLAAAVKAPAALALPFVAVLAFPRVWRGLAVAGAVAVAAFAAVTAVSGLGLGWVQALRTPGDSVQWTSLPTGLGLAAGWVLGSREPALTVARAVGTLVALVVVGLLWWRVRGRGGDPRAVVAACGWSLAVVVLLAPAFHPWYALWALVPLAASTVDGRVRAGLAGGTVALCFLVLPDGYNLARATVLPGVLLDLAVLVGLVVLLARRRSRVPA
jgi:alpha-1,6-mannosyltransferase